MRRSESHTDRAQAGGGVAASKKTRVIEFLWELLEADCGRRVVTFDDIEHAIKHCNTHYGLGLRTSNPANFMKDLLRGSSASTNWPKSLSERRITAKQIKGSRRAFQFVEFEDDQTEPFPMPFEPVGDEAVSIVQSVSLPLATKSLGRADESWLVQVAVHLRVLEHHFASKSSLQVVEISHLQVGVKLGKSEIDSLFLAVIEEEDGSRKNALITCEAKQTKDPILADQIVQQVVDAYASITRLDLNIGILIPVAIKAINRKASIYLVEFEPWNPEEAGAAEATLKRLRVASTGLYELRPPVPGIGYNPSIANKKARKPKV
jgi:hypothetical protein